MKTCICGGEAMTTYGEFSDNLTDCEDSEFTFTLFVKICKKCGDICDKCAEESLQNGHIFKMMSPWAIHSDNCVNCTLPPK